VVLENGLEEAQALGQAVGRLFLSQNLLKKLGRFLIEKIPI
jgi:hypothetical protein